MLQIAYIREHADEVVDRLKVRNMDARTLIDDVLKADQVRRESQTELDQLLSESKQLSAQIGQLFKEGKRDEAEVIRARTTELKEHTQAVKDRMQEGEQQLFDLLTHIPNLPHPSVPAGSTDEDNVVLSTEGDIPELYEGAKPHWDLIEQYDIIDFALGAKITGAGFPVYKGKGAKLQRALINWFLDEAIDAGYSEVLPPLMVNEASGFGTGQLPDKEGQMYHMQNDNLYMIPTAEVPITNLYRDTILKAKDFPIKMAGYSSCFRREAGAWGANVRGLNRLHQFEKVEIVRLEHPSNSYAVLEEMVEHITGLLRKLELPFRVLRLCGGDLGFTSALTIDMEVYSAAQGRWLEVSSASNFETFQANRLKLRFKEDGGKAQLAHTLNGSALALPRIVASILENNQDADGIRIPAVLVPYTGFDRIN